MVIQNSDTIFLRWDDDHHQIFFPKERISNKKIKTITAISGNVYGQQLLAPTGEFVTYCGDSVDSATDTNDTISIFDGADRHILDYYALRNIAFANNYDYTSYGNHKPLHELNSEINPSLSFVSIDPTRTVETGYNAEIVPIVVVYDTDEPEPQVISTRCKSFYVNTDEKQIKLSDITAYFLKGRKIKKMEIWGRDDFSPNSATTNYSIIDKWITIKTTDGKAINQIPSLFFAKWGVCVDNYNTELVQPMRRTSDILFSDLAIDEDESFIENPTGNVFQAKITFYY